MKVIAEHYAVVGTRDIYLMDGGHYRLEVHERIWETPPDHLTPSFNVAYWIYGDNETLEAVHLGWVLEFDAESALAAGLQILRREG